MLGSIQHFYEQMTNPVEKSNKSSCHTGSCARVASRFFRVLVVVRNMQLILKFHYYLCFVIALFWVIIASPATIYVFAQPAPDLQAYFAQYTVPILEKSFINSVGMEFVFIPAGSFMMGADDPDFPFPDGVPQHKVIISKSFYLGKYEVTQAQWETVMGDNPSAFQDPNNPVEMVGWDDAYEFIRHLNAHEGHSRYRLPTEAEWEYAARAGTDASYFFGYVEKKLSGYAWYQGNSAQMTHPVGQKQPNAWGLHDVYGNVWEWVQDWHGADYYTYSPEIDPTGPLTEKYRAYRGGSWDSNAQICQSALRGYGSPDYREGHLGFRLALSLE